MAPKNKFIIDTDPGVDDIMAMLLALSSCQEDLELAMISVTYGNVPLQSCLRNTVAMFHVLEKELEWRRSTGRPEGFKILQTSKPIVAAGAEHSLESRLLAADYFHGADGLHNVHEVHQDLSPDDTWKSLFKEGDDFIDHTIFSPHFKPSKERAHKEMLRILRENPVDTVSIIVLGPATNVALAAEEDPETFVRAKEVIVMGGAVHVCGNITPVGEFNSYADPTAAARLYALTSRMPKFTMPPPPPDSNLRPYPENLSRQLNLTLCPLDITNPHLIERSYFQEQIKHIVASGSPLARWVAHFLNGAFNKIEIMMEGGEVDPGLSMHDPLTVWYLLTHDDPRWKSPAQLEDIRVETAGQWTRGMHIIDTRGKRKTAEPGVELSDNPDVEPKFIPLEDEPGDTMGWLGNKGNRVRRLIESPGEDVFKHFWMQSVFAFDA